jgi:uncharacterized protein YbcC (UPF0753/DUF2309 family)
MQSVMYGDQRAHDPVRLLAIVEAPLGRIDVIIDRNPGLRELVEGERIHVVARRDEHDDWWLRRPDTRWDRWRPADPEAAATADLLTPLELS